MPAKGKCETLPPDMRKRLDARLIDRGFANYREFREWLLGEGYEISHATVHRYANRLEQRIAQIDSSTRAASALMESNPDAEGNLSAATIKAAQSGLFDLIMAVERGDTDKMTEVLKVVGRTTADLARADIALRRERERALAEASVALDKELKRQGLSGSTADAIREALTTV